MATRLSNDYYTIAVPDDTTYGTQELDLTAAVAMSDVICEIHSDIMTQPTKIKTNVLYPDHEETIETASAASCTLKGNLCVGYEWLLYAYTGTAASPYVMAETAALSYSIYKYYSGTSPYYDVALGCVCSDLKITGEANGIIQFEATFRAKSMRRGIASTGADEATTVPANTPSTPFLFGNITDVYTPDTDLASFMSFALNLSKQFVDDKITYQNSLTKQAEIPLGYSGTFECANIYDDVNSPDSENNIGSATGASFTLNTLSVSWTFILLGRYSAFDAPDADKSLIEAKTTIELADAAPITVTIGAR
jgi:hypothetical protein